MSAAPRVPRGGGDALKVRRPRRRRGPGAPTAPPHPPSARARRRVRPALPHLASSSSGVSGHLAAKWAVTALDAEAVRAPSSESQSAVKPRSSRTTPAAFAMVRTGKREPLRPGAFSPQPPRYSRLLPSRDRPLPVGGARVRYTGRGPHSPGGAWGLWDLPGKSGEAGEGSSGRSQAGSQDPGAAGLEAPESSPRP